MLTTRGDRGADSVLERPDLRRGEGLDLLRLCSRKRKPGRAPGAKAKPISSTTARRELGVLQAALNHAHEEGVLIHPVKVSLPEAGEPKDRWLTRSEAAKLLRAASPHLRRFILLSLYTGRRMSAVLNLTWTRIDMDADMIRFRADGKRETNKRRGRVRITRQLAAHLRRWRAISGRETHVVSFRGKPIGSVNRAFGDARDGAGLGPDVTRHTLKHTAITWAVMAGADIEDAAEFFDTSPATIRAQYGTTVRAIRTGRSP